MRELGSRLAADQPDQEVHLFLTHAHYDHVEGLPFFAPFFGEGKKVTVYCGPLDGSNSTKETVENLMRRPYFPVGPDVFCADVNYIDLNHGDAFDLPKGLRVSTTELNHPGGAIGYRIDFEGHSFACMTDTEHVQGKLDDNVMSMIDGVDAFIYDCSLTDEEYPDFVGFGHSTYEEGLRLQRETNAGMLIAFHHMPFRIDKELLDIEKSLKEPNEQNMIAREGFKFSI